MSNIWKIILVIGVVVLAGFGLLLGGGMLNRGAQTPTPALPPSAAKTGQPTEPTNLPQPSPTPPPAAATDTPVPPVDEASARLKVPAGFAVRTFAQNLNGTPRFMAFGEDRQLYVSLMGSGQIARLPDADKNGQADRVEIVASGLNQPHGLEWHAGWLYVAENDRVERLRDNGGSGVLNQRELVTDNLPGGSGHVSRTIHFGPDGLMYVSAGSSCNVCAESDPRRAAILRFNPDGSIPPSNPFAGDPDPRKRAVWAWGLRNSVDFAWTPDGALWANLNGRDGLGDTQPPEALVIAVQGGKSHGWPYCVNTVLGVNAPLKAEALDTKSELALPAGFDCSLNKVQPALFTVLAHSAPLGMTFGTHAAFPAEFQKDVFEALHGSWNTTSGSIRDCQVVRVVLQNGVPVRSETFISGWRAEGRTCGDAATWGRPADVIFGPDGSLFISDDKGGRVYRVAYVGP